MMNGFGHSSHQSSKLTTMLGQSRNGVPGAPPWQVGKLRHITKISKALLDSKSGSCNAKGRRFSICEVFLPGFGTQCMAFDANECMSCRRAFAVFVFLERGFWSLCQVLFRRHGAVAWGSEMEVFLGAGPGFDVFLRCCCWRNNPEALVLPTCICCSVIFLVSPAGGGRDAGAGTQETRAGANLKFYHVMLLWEKKVLATLTEGSKACNCWRPGCDLGRRT